MKSILIVIYAQYVKLIIEGKKTVEVRKNKNLANAIKKLIAEQGGCWIYIYVAKSTPELYVTDDGFVLTDFGLGEHYKFKCLLNGKIVARFWCDKVDGIICNMPSRFVGEDYNDDDATFAFESKNECMSIEQLAELACIEDDEKLFFYLNADKVNYGIQKLVGYAIHVSKLEVFERPRELSEFGKYGFDFIGYAEEKSKVGRCFGKDNYLFNKHIRFIPLTKAPQNFVYIENEE